MHWQFWLDVGGTFTDCLGLKPDGTLVRCKVLSSGITKGSVGPGSTAEEIVDPLRRGETPGFWEGYSFQLLASDGRILATSRVVQSKPGTAEQPAGRLKLSPPLDVAPEIGAIYELASHEEAPLVAIRSLLGLRLAEPIQNVSVRLGTTRGTNALLTRRGARTAFITTRGFADILRIGYQNRPRLFDVKIRKPTPLFAEVIEIDERVGADGQVLVPLDETQARDALASLRGQGIDSLAICLLHAYRQPAHEQRLGELARGLGFAEVSLSSAVAPLVKIVARGDTTVLDAYLNPILRSYVAKLRAALGDCELRLMTSAGGLVTADKFVGKDSILSGPAGGVVGFSRAAEAAGFPRAIGFDMGGTSTDVSRFDGTFEREFETEKAGVRVVAPMLSIETVAAGGGSLCGFDGVKLTVGPDSAGARPGPACYGNGGPLAVTDLNFYLGKISEDYFPFPLDRRAVERRLDELRETIRAATGHAYSRAELADGFLRVANANMVQALRSISVAKGYDPRDYVLVAFGGAAPQHACAVADELGMKQVLIHPEASLLSAYGMGLADVTRHREQGVYRPYSPDAVRALDALFSRLAQEAREEILAEGIGPARIQENYALDLRYQRTDAFLTIPRPEDGDYAAAFVALHEQRYGYCHAGRPLEIVAVRVEVVGRTAERPVPLPRATARDVTSEVSRTITFQAQPHAAAIFQAHALRSGDRLHGPAVICEPHASTIVDPGWQAERLPGGEFLLSRTFSRESFSQKESASEESAKAPADPVLLEIFNHQFAGIAEQMGITLRNTSSSVNVKERLDFSCAVFTARGELVVNAPHIPVHLGAMSLTVQAILADNPQMLPGDVFVTNDPYRGGSHLPDVTVVTPVHEPRDGRLLFFTASRAHHAELGGIAPGSMPPFSRNLAEEGILIRNFKLVAAGQSRFDEFRALLSSGAYPSRNPQDNLADVAAQVAANQQGARDLIRLIEQKGLALVLAYMGHIQDAAERKMRHALDKLTKIRREFRDHLDDGTPIAVSLTWEEDELRLDFSGSGPVSPHNLNANQAIVTSAVMYCLRLLIAEDIPLNQGVLSPIRLRIPPGLLNPSAGATPETSPAVVGGNVETSQRVVDVLLGALELAAASQGTMNNLTFGDPTFGYYETICGGSGGSPAGEGADAVHTHMTNTRLTDPEVLELRYPVRVREFRIRLGSGGAGRFRGGDGVVRRLEFLRPLAVSILAQRRGPYPPYGLQGGQPGALGRNALTKANGEVQELPGRVQFEVQPGDVLTIETPGGGGFGSPHEKV